MALENIINQIESETNIKIQEIESEKNKTLFHLEEKKTKEIAKRKKEILDETEKTKKKMIAKIRFEVSSETKDKLAEKKFNIINSVYIKTLDQLKAINTEDYLKLIDYYWKNISIKGNYQVFIADNRENETADFFRLKGIEVDGKIKSIGGFIIKTNDLEIDSTFETIIKQIKQDTESEVVKILFK